MQVRIAVRYNANCCKLLMRMAQHRRCAVLLGQKTMRKWCEGADAAITFLKQQEMPDPKGITSSYLCLIQVRLDLSKLVRSVWILQGTKAKSMMIASFRMSENLKFCCLNPRLRSSTLSAISCNSKGVLQQRFSQLDIVTIGCCVAGLLRILRCCVCAHIYLASLCLKI